MTPTPVGMRCPECSRQRTKVRSGPAAYSTTPTLTYIIIGICVALQFGQSASAGRDDIFVQGALYGPNVADGELWRLVTSGFLHAGLIHLAFNMYALYILGSMLEPAIGRVRFGLLYFVSMLCGSFGALLLTPDKPTVGASGAVFGLMAGAIVIMRNRGIDPMASGLPFWLGLNLVLTFTLANLSVGGHLGGIVGGVLTAILLFELPDRVRLPQLAPALLAGALGAAAIAGSVAVVA